MNYADPDVPVVPGMCLVVNEELEQFSPLYEGRDERSLTFAEVSSSPDKHLWKEAIVKELSELGKLDTWELATLPADRKCMKHKWVFKRKLQADGTVERYKAHIVGKGFTQKDGVDYHDTFMSVICPESVRTVIHAALQKSLQVFQLDIGNAFLNAYLNVGYTCWGFEWRFSRIQGGKPKCKQAAK